MKHFTTACLAFLLVLIAGCRGTPLPKARPLPDDPMIAGGHTHGYADLPGTVVRSDGTIPFTAPQQGVAPIGASDIATKAYVDAFGTTDPELAAIAGLTSAADKVPYYTGSGSAALANFPSFGRALVGTNASDALDALGFTAFTKTLVDDTTSTGARTTLGLIIGTDVQAYDAELSALAGLTSAADKYPYFTGSGTATVGTITTFGRSLVDDTDASTALSTLGFTAFTKTIIDDSNASDVRTTLGLGTIATQAANNVTITGGAISGITDLPLADGGTGTTLSDPNADRVMFWDDSAGHVEWLTMGTNLSITGTTINAAGGSNNLLDGSNHTDTDAGTPVEGDLIMGNATPHWAKLAKGTIYQKLGRGGTGSVASWIGDDAPVGGFWKLNPAANGTAQVIPFASSGGSVATYFVPIYSGTIRGISWTFSGTHTLGTITIRARKNGSAVTGLVYGPSGTTDLSGYTTANGNTFAAGDTLGLEYDTSAAWNGTAGQLVVTLWLGIDG